MEHLTHVDAGRLEAVRTAGGYTWLDLTDPSHDELHEAARVLGLPALAVEDSKEFRQRAKIDDYGDRVLVVFYGAQDEHLVEVHLHVSGTEVLTVRRGRCDALDRVRVDHARSEEDLVYHLLDALADSVLALVDRHLERAEALEDAAYERPDDAERRQIAELRADLFGIGQTVTAQREMLGRGAGKLEGVPGLEHDEARHPFRDVHDDLVLTANRIAYGRELLAQALDVHLASQGNRLNQLATRLTLVATIFLPLTFVTGFFGQNFEWLVASVDTRRDFLLFGIGGCVVAILVPIAFYWWAGLIGRRGRRP